MLLQNKAANMIPANTTMCFFYHGLPNRHLEKSHPGITVSQCSCQNAMPEHGHRCYRATCFATTRLLAKELGLKPRDYTVGFQSRLDKNWMELLPTKSFLKN
jgi:protoporphyrin/coproporphyrin ferrochelatase